MDASLNKKKKAPLRSPAVVMSLIIGGIIIGIILALAFNQLLFDSCQGDLSCQRPVAALFGGIALLHAVSIMLIFALVDHLNRRSENRLLEAFRLQSGSVTMQDRGSQ